MNRDKYYGMAKNFCPSCGAEQKHEEAEICPSCGVRVRDPPVHRWTTYLAAGGFIAGIAALVILVFLLGVWQGSLHSAPAQNATPAVTPPPETSRPTPAPTRAANLSTAMPETDYISSLSGDINISRVEGTLAKGGTDLFSFSIWDDVHLTSLTLEGPAGADFDLYVKKGGTPTPEDYGWRSVTDGSFERIELWGPPQGSYTVLVYARSGEGAYVLTRSTSFGKKNTGTAIETQTETIPAYYWSSPFSQPADWVA